MSSSLELSSTFLPTTIFGLSGQWGVIAFNSSRKGNGTRKKFRRTMIMNLWWVRENALWFPEVWLVSVSQSSSSSHTEDYNSIKFPKPQNECETATSTENLSGQKKNGTIWVRKFDSVWRKWRRKQNMENEKTEPAENRWSEKSMLFGDGSWGKRVAQWTRWGSVRGESE